MASIGSVLRFAASLTWIAFSRISLFVLFGFILNIILFWYLPDMCDLTGAASGWWAYMTELATNCTFAFVISLLFMPLLPIAYGFLGYKYAIQKGVHYAYVQNKDTFYRYTTNKLVNFIDKNAAMSKGMVGAVGLAGKFMHKMDGMPFFFRKVMQVLSKVVPFVDIVDRINNDLELSASNESAIASRLANEADTYIQDELLQPDLTLFWILVGVNAVFFGLIMFFFA